MARFSSATGKTPRSASPPCTSFQVPKSESHYQVHFCCTTIAEYAARQSFGARNVGRRGSESQQPRPGRQPGSVQRHSRLSWQSLHRSHHRRHRSHRHPGRAQLRRSHRARRHRRRLRPRLHRRADLYLSRPQLRPVPSTAALYPQRFPPAPVHLAHQRNAFTDYHRLGPPSA